MQNLPYPHSRRLAINHPAASSLRKSLIPIFLFLIAIFIATQPSFAQSTFGQISGTVTDPSGAVIPGATIDARSAATGALRTTTSDDHGDFSLVDLDPGTYTVTITASGFSSREIREVALLARQSLKVAGALKLAAGTTEVQVTSGAELIDQDLTVSDSKSGAEISQLALNFRASLNTSPIIVANLAPAVQPDQNGNISIAGQLPNMTAFSLDGISTQSVRNGGPNTDMFPSVESIAEFKVNTAGNDAEFGQPSDLTVTSKSGTNKFHGSGFWFHQNAAFNAADPFLHAVLPVVANDFGGTIGGPIPVSLLKDKTFFFFTYEGTRRPHRDPITEAVPTDAERGGILPEPVVNPFTQTVTTDLSQFISPVSAKILTALFPVSTLKSASAGQTNLFTSIAGSYTLDNYDGRIDQSFTANHKVFGRYTHKDIVNTGNGGDGNYNPLLGSLSNTQALRNLAAAYTWIVKPNLVNELRGGLTFVNTAVAYPLAKQGAALNASFGISNLPPVPSSGGVPNFQVSNFVDPGGAVAGSAGTNGIGRPRHVQQRIYEVGDNLSWIKGGHELKFGGNYSRNSYVDQITFTAGDEFGDYFYSGAFTSYAAAGISGDPFADFLLGLTSEADYAQNGPDGRPYASHYGLFAQDTWKATKRLTISYGLRYEVNPPFNDETNQLSQFDRKFTGGRIIVQGQKGLDTISPSWRAQVGDTPFISNSAAGLPSSLRNTYWKNFQPRLGFAWDAYGTGRTVVKAHAGTYSVPVLGAVLYSLLGVSTSNFPEFIASATNILLLPNVFGGSGTFPINCNSPSTLPTGASAGSPSCPGYRRANDENLVDPHVVQWNASVEQALSSNTVLKLNYTGSHATKLIYSPDLNQVQPNTVGYAALTATPALRQQNLKYPNFGEVLTRDNGPSATYHAGSAELTRRFSNGLTYTGSYTWAKNLSNALGSAPGSLIGSGGQGDNGPNTLDYYNIRRDIGNVVYTRRNRFVSTFLYQLPFGKGRQFANQSGKLADLAIGGWDMTGIALVQSGAFLTPTFSPSTDPSGTNPGQRSAGAYQRPDCVPGVNPNQRTVPGLYFNPAAFSIPGANIGRFGNCPVGFLHGPGTAVFSTTVGKDFHLTEGVSIRYEAAFANLLNIENLAVPSAHISTGQSTTPGASNAVTAANDGGFGSISSVQSQEQGGPRTIQMSLRIRF